MIQLSKEKYDSLVAEFHKLKNSNSKYQQELEINHKEIDDPSNEEQLQKELEVAREELSQKIKEISRLNKIIFDMKNSKEKDILNLEIEKLKEKLNSEAKKNEDAIVEIEKLKNSNIKLKAELKLKDNALISDSENYFNQLNIPAYEKKQDKREILQEILLKSNDLIQVANLLDEHLIRRHLPLKKNSHLNEFFHKKLNFNQNLKEFRYWMEISEILFLKFIILFENHNVVGSDNFEFKFYNISFKHSNLISKFAKFFDFLEEIIEKYEKYHFNKTTKEKRVCRKQRMNFSESEEFFSSSLSTTLNLPLIDFFESFKIFSNELKVYLKEENNDGILNLIQKFEDELYTLTQLELNRSDSQQTKNINIANQNGSNSPSSLNYFKDGNSEIVNLKKRSVAFKTLINENLKLELNNLNENQIISQEDAVEYRSQTIELNEMILKLKEKIKDQKLEILRFQNELENCRNLNLSYEKECYDVFVKLQMILQQYTELDSNQIVQLSNEENISSSFSNFYHFVKNIIQHLQKELDRVNAERSKLQNLLTKSLLSKSKNSSNEISEEDQEEEGSIQQESSLLIKEVKISEDDFFSSESVDREHRLKEKYETKINYLLGQIEACDLKSCDYRIQWQLAVSELEESSKIEKQLSVQLTHLRDILEQTQDELNTTKINYENQIALLSLKLTSDQ
eukprot:gene1950-1458_t